MISSVMNWRCNNTSNNHWISPYGTCFWENIIYPSKLLNHRPFTNTDFESIFADKIASSAFTQYSSNFNPVTTCAIDGGMMGFIDPKLLTWFRSSCWILIGIASRTGTIWFWSYFPKLYRSDSSILMVMRSCTEYCTLDMAVCAPAYIELIWLLIWFRLALRIWNSFIEDTPSLFTSNTVFSASSAHLLAWSHIWPIVFTVVVS